MADLDGNNIADLFEENQTIDDQVNENQTNNQTDNQANNTNATTDSDGDGVSDLFDNCPNTPPSSQIDTNGCVVTMRKKTPLQKFQIHSFLEQMMLSPPQLVSEPFFSPYSHSCKPML